LRSGGVSGGISAVFGGVIVGTVGVIASVSFAALIFSGPLLPHLEAGIGIALLSGVVAGLASAVLGSHPVVISGPQGAPATILAIIAAAVVARLAAAPPEDVLPTVVAAIGASTALTGLVLMIMGTFRLGDLIRFIPYPVVGGFLAASGWLLVRGAFAVMVGAPLSFEALPGLFVAGAPARWIPGVAFAVALLLTMRRLKHFLTLPGLLAAGVAGFYVAAAALGVGSEDLRKLGLLVRQLPDATLWPPFGLDALRRIHLDAVAGSVADVGTIVIIAAVSILLNASAFELIVKKPLNLNRELQSVGLANLVGGAGGSIVGYHSLGNSVLAWNAGARSRLAGLTCAAVCAFVVFVRASIVSYVPNGVLGGLLMFTGMNMLYDWLIDARHRLPGVDYVVVVLITAAVGFIGFLEGVAVGTVVAVLLFVLNYSRIDVVRHALDGSTLRSKVDRVRAQDQALRERGAATHIYELQGFLFFGTANKLLERIQARCEEAGAAPRFVILDFRGVNGIDSSAVLSFKRLVQYARDRRLVLFFAEMSASVARQTERAGLRPEPDGTLCFEPDLDRAAERCEDAILAEAGLAGDGAEAGLTVALRGLDPALLPRLLSYITREEAPEGTELIRQGSDANDLLILERGEVTVLLELPAGGTIRLRRSGAGTIVGEVGLYLNARRSASVLASKPSVVYRLSADGLERMRIEDADLAVAFHQLIARTLAERLTDGLRTIQALRG